MKQRGTIFTYGEAQVFATVHPAAVLRNPRNSSIFNADISAFSRLIRGEPQSVPVPKTILVNNKDTLVKACKAILKSEAVAYDIETVGFEEKAEDGVVVMIAVAVKPGVAFSIPIHHPEASWKDPNRVLRLVTHALTFTNAKRIAHNAKFDDRWLCEHAGPIKADFDTMIAAHILDENRFKALEVLSTMLLGVDSWKGKVNLSNGGALEEPLKRLARYNAKDADYTLRLYYLFRTDLLKPGNERTLRIFSKLLMPASRSLTDIERVGMWVDQERLSTRRIEIHQKMRKVNKKLTRLAGYEANWNSPPQIAKILFQDLGLPLIEVTGKGNPSTRESVLLRLRDEHEIAARILEYRALAKNENTYLRKWSTVMIDGRLYPNYKLTGTVTGRLASGKEEKGDTRVGMQQVPRDPFIRGILGSPPGWSFVEADFSQVELRIAAHYSQEPTMMRLFQMDQDIHLQTAVQVTGKPPERISKEERKKAKAVNFGFLFGMGYKKFVDYARDNYEVVVELDEAKKVRDKFFTTFRGLRPWHERQRRLVRKYGRVQSAIGRVRHLPDIESQDEEVRQEAERQAINSPVQGLASDMMLLAMNMLHAEMPPEEARIVGSVHDSLLIEVRDDRVDYWAPYVKHVMENLPLKKKFGATLTVPIKVDVTVGTHWGEGKLI
jgi:DNA polymerase-1